MVNSNENRLRIERESLTCNHGWEASSLEKIERLRGFGFSEVLSLMEGQVTTCFCGFLLYGFIEDKPTRPIFYLGAIAVRNRVYGPISVPRKLIQFIAICILVSYKFHFQKCFNFIFWIFKFWILLMKFWNFWILHPNISNF